jgi:hypothetical protein
LRRGLPATGKTFVITGMTIDEWDGDRIVEEWTSYDLLRGLQQLGVIPEMARPEATGLSVATTKLAGPLRPGQPICRTAASAPAAARSRGHDPCGGSQLTITTA